MELDHENFITNLFWSKNVKSDVKSITIHSLQSWSNQNDSSWKLKLQTNEKLTENSVLLKIVDWQHLYDSVFRFEKGQFLNE